MLTAPARYRGFTLIELMVVMLIVGIAMGMISLGLDVLRSRDDQLALERLHMVLEACAERANLRGQPVELELLEDGYRFAEYDVDDKWHALESPPLFIEKRLPTGYRWAGLRQDRPTPPNRLQFGAMPPNFELALKTPQGIVLYRGRETGRVILDTSAMEKSS